MADFETMGS